MNIAELNHLAEQLRQQLHLSQMSLTPLTRPVHIDFYKKWLEQGYHGDMKYLEQHLPLKTDPQNLIPGQHLQSAFVFTCDYLPHPKPSKPSSLRTALYAQGEDYHVWFKQKLESVAAELKKAFPEHQFFCATDATPVLERDLALQAGLGWIGKNTCLIHPKKGSLFFIGEILCTIPASVLEIKPQLMQDFCGKCQRCIDICPTQALQENKTLNANLCISYLTIESQKLPPTDLIPKIGDWFFGCDLCQSVCPWNQKIWKQTEHFAKLDTNPIRPSHGPEDRQMWISELQEILRLSGKQLSKKFALSALSRARPFGLRRNAMVVAINQNLHELLPDIEKYLSDEKLGPLAQIAVNRLKI